MTSALFSSPSYKPKCEGQAVVNACFNWHNSFGFYGSVHAKLYYVFKNLIFMCLTVYNSGSTLCSCICKLAKMRFLSIVFPVFLVLYKKSTLSLKNVDLIFIIYITSISEEWNPILLKKHLPQPVAYHSKTLKRSDMKFIKIARFYFSSFYSIFFQLFLFFFFPLHSIFSFS